MIEQNKNFIIMQLLKQRKIFYRNLDKEIYRYNRQLKAPKRDKIDNIFNNLQANENKLAKLGVDVWQEMEQFF